uniref:hypothetical protein n=1 Tax=Candidatus Stercorousia sp. TaxID=3048886 RepID=UPI004028B3C3
MITPINTPQSNLMAQALLRKSPNGKTEANNPNRSSIFYINDFHGKSINMERTITASNAFDAFIPSVPTDKLKLSSGDIQLGEPVKANQVMVEAQNIMGIMASAMGNHEYDMPKHIAELIPQMGYKMLACNINIKPDNPLYKKVDKSYIQEVNGNKYEIIG